MFALFGILNWPLALFTFVTMEVAGRIQQVITHYGLSASAFADRAGVPRSSISHILSGRNKPSLDFIIKTINAFPEVDLYWLLNGKGSFPTPKKKETPATPSSSNQNPNPPISALTVPSKTKKQIAHILICYTDGTFESYQENESAN